MAVQITEIRIKLGAPAGDDRQLATATLVFDFQFAVHNYRIVEGAGTLFVQHPADAHPIRHDHREKIDQAIIRAYESEKARLAPTKQPRPMERFLHDWRSQSAGAPAGVISHSVPAVSGFSTR